MGNLGAGVDPEIGQHPGHGCCTLVCTLFGAGGGGVLRAAVWETRNVSESIFREDAAVHCSQKACGVSLLKAVGGADSPTCAVGEEGRSEEAGV